ncbi:MAG: hypothetical protein LQ342_004997 [Letrouitia transgressa]|nr:MAG: hypothetical protein LQ342_004997 [Letrouitia transgressa]
MSVPKFHFPVKDLSNDQVKLEPFIASKHGPAFFSASAPYPEIYAHIPRGPYDTESSFLSDLIEPTHSDPDWLVFAVISLSDPPGALAGVIAYLNTSPVHLVTELGMVITFPAFRGSGVTANAVGLLLQHALDAPELGGLGLRRVVWQANSVNGASRRLAEKMGFRFEAVLRWDRVFRDGKRKGKVGNGRALPRGAGEGDLGRDTVVYAICWDEWEEGGREKVREVMERK